MEQWKTIIEHPYYEISNYGRIKKIKTGRILRGSSEREGYVHFTTKYEGIVFRSTVHRLVCKYFIDNPNNYDCINHINCNRRDNHYLNLEWCTKQMNTDHAVNLGRIPRRAVINTKTGEVLRSAYALANHLGWTKSKVKHYLCGRVKTKIDWEYATPKGIPHI